MRQRAALFFAVTLVLVLVLVLVLAMVMVGRLPLFLPPLPEGAPPLPAGQQRVFGYATLTNPVVRGVVAGRWLPGEPAVLEGHERIGRNLREDVGALVTGVVFTVPPEALQRLDRYERAGDRYARELLTLADGTTAWVYRLIDPGEGD